MMFCGHTQVFSSRCLLSLMIGIFLFCGQSVPGWGAGTVTIALYQEPETLNPYLGTGATIGLTIRPSVEGLIGVNPQGEFYPVLAETVPTVQNGGVSP
ncbi:MAG: hypothetical protein D6736_03375, partial [Nitrospinota bacterium]